MEVYEPPPFNATVTVGATVISGGVTSQLLYDNAGVIGEVTKANSSVLITSGAGVPSWATTLPANLTLVGTTNFGGTNLFNTGGLVAYDLTAMYVRTQAATPLFLGANSTNYGQVTSAGSFMWGTAALATNVTDGFLYIPTCAGTPTGVPTASTGLVPMIYDTTNHQFWFYDGGWKQPKTPAGAAIVTWQ